MGSKFYNFSQNNSGGFFNNNHSAGIGVLVIIEALNADDANDRAEEIGIYFDGCDDNIDCDCCGDRWYAVDEADGEEIPKVYGTLLSDVVKSDYRENCYLHKLDGTFELIEFKE